MGRVIKDNCVGVLGIEPSASASRTLQSTDDLHPVILLILHLLASFCYYKSMEYKNKKGQYKAGYEYLLAYKISVPTIPDYPNFPDLPNDVIHTVNLMIILVNQAIYLQKRLQQSLEQKFIKEGGFRENLFKKRLIHKSTGYQKCYNNVLVPVAQRIEQRSPNAPMEVQFLSGIHIPFRSS